VAGGGQSASENRCCDGVEINLTSSPRIVPFEVLGSQEQELRGVTPSFGSERHSGPEHLELCAFMVVQGASFGAGGEFQGRIKRARLPFGFGRREHSSNSMLRIDCEFSRSLQEGRGGCNAAAGLGSVGRHLQILCHFVVGMPRGLGQVPGAAVRVESSIGSVSECSVHTASVSRGCRLVNGRTNQRMAENYSRGHFQQAINVAFSSCGFVDSKVPGGTPHKTRVARRIGRSDEEEVPGRRR
jgi:hypothetical protein